MAKTKPIKAFTEHQLNRLPDPGYHVTIWPLFVRGVYDSNGRILPGITPPNRTTEDKIGIECIMNGQCKYSRSDIGTRNEPSRLNDWSTLLWSCATTRRGLNDTSWGQIHEFYPTFEALQRAMPIMVTKAPNDNTEIR